MRYLSIRLSIFLLVCVLAGPARAANKSGGAAPDKPKTVWTNDEIEKLRLRGLITVFNVPQAASEVSAAAEVPAPAGPYDKMKDPVWYADQATRLQAELASAQMELQQYRKGLDDARSLKRMTGGIALEQDTIGITPEAGLEILESRVRDVAVRIDALEELARHNGFPPGLTRG